MRIVLDARYKVQSGASSYIKNLVPKLLDLGTEDEFYLVRYPEQEFEFEPRMDGVLVSPSSDLASLAWTFTTLPRRLRTLRADVYHALKMPGPVFGSCRRIFTMHSIMDRYKGEFPVNLKTRLFIALYVNRVLGRMDHIISVSDFVTECLTERHGIDPSRASTVYHGVDPRFRACAAPGPSEGDHTAPTILCVGNITPVKNHLTAVRAFAAVAPELPHQLVIAGGTADDYYERVAAEVEHLGLKDRVRFVGFVGVDQLVELMNRAALLVFPSLTEGCPVTMLEAFGCGLPILAAKRGGLWDLGRHYCRFVEDPLDHAAFARQMSAILGSPETLSMMRAASLRAAASFSWGESAQRHLEIYHRYIEPADG